MKKVKITLRSGSPGKKFYLFPSSEALYMWLCTVERGEQIQIPDIEELFLEPGGFIEAELRGFEYAYEGAGKFRRLELIRLGKTQATSNASGILVSTHKGWVSGGLLPMKHYSDTDIDARVLGSHEPKLDLAALFGDEPVSEDDSVDIEVDEDPSDDGDGT